VSAFRRTNVNATPARISTDPARLQRLKRSPRTAAPRNSAIAGVNTPKKLTVVESHVFSSEK
jgi:hypothetical protein